MKKFFYFCLMALTCMVGFTACGDDDDDSKSKNDDVSISKAVIKDNGNVLTLTVTASQYGQTASAVTKESAILSPIYRERYRFRRCTSASWQTPISR